MSVFFNVRAGVQVLKKILLDGDKAVANGAVFTEIVGTRASFYVQKDSLVEIRVAATLAHLIGSQVDLDIGIDGVLLGWGAAAADPQDLVNGAAFGLASSLAPTALTNLPVSIREVLDTLAEGQHTVALYAKSDGAGQTILADPASAPLKLTITQSASVYPPTSPTG